MQSVAETLKARHDQREAEYSLILDKLANDVPLSDAELNIIDVLGKGSTVDSEVKTRQEIHQLQQVMAKEPELHAAHIENNERYEKEVAPVKADYDALAKALVTLSNGRQQRANSIQVEINKCRAARLRYNQLTAEKPAAQPYNSDAQDFTKAVRESSLVAGAR